MARQNMEFRTEVTQLLDLMIHSLYSHKEIFLRELISNASDAIDKARYQALTNEAVLEDDKDFGILIKADKEKKTLTISDNGIGMTRDEIITQLGTIAHSGTQEFIAALQTADIKNQPELIGQFGVGFYSSFMVSDKVTVISRKAGSGDKNGIIWESEAEGTYTIDDCVKETKGTDVILHIKDDEKDYLSEWEIRTVIKKYSDYISYPIQMEVERNRADEKDKDKQVMVKEIETINKMKAIWLRNRSEIEDNEYNEFYKHISHDYTDPAKVIHYKAEGTNEFSALLFIPSKAPFNILFREFKVGLNLYINRVQIMEHCEDLLPQYLRFVKGVVDAADLPLNVSREILQSNKKVEVIRKNITKKVLDTLKEVMDNDFDKYLPIYKEFGKVLKEGIHIDHSKREAIGDLLLFDSMKAESGKMISLQHYIDTMPIKQGDNIYFKTAKSREEIIDSPYLEAFKKNDFDVFFMTDEVDGFVFENYEYNGKKFKSIVKGDLELDEKAKDTAHKGLLEAMKGYLKDEVEDVRPSGRLTDSPCCLVTGDASMDPNMERLLKSMGQDVPGSKRILEINQDHPIVKSMEEAYDKDKEDPMIKRYSMLLFNQAVILEGSIPKDTAGFSRLISEMMVENVKSKG